MKRSLDILGALTGVILLALPMAAMALAIWIEDRHSPFFIARRVARGGGDFFMLKFRTMIPDAWRNGVNSTAAGDRRITRVGGWLRKAKLDELPQLWNVLTGEMSLAGPRAQVRAEVDLYTAEERRMLLARPGITDLASIVFADEAEILAGAADPDLLYNQIIRPWKSRLALLYIEHQTLAVDLQIIFLTLAAGCSRGYALKAIEAMLRGWGAGELVLSMASRKSALIPYPPPGATDVIGIYPKRATV